MIPSSSRFAVLLTALSLAITQDSSLAQQIGTPPADVTRGFLLGPAAEPGVCRFVTADGFKYEYGCDFSDDLPLEIMPSSRPGGVVAGLSIFNISFHQFPAGFYFMIGDYQDRFRASGNYKISISCGGCETIGVQVFRYQTLVSAIDLRADFPAVLTTPSGAKGSRLVP